MEPETHVGPDGNTYATARCKVCGIVCHGMSGAYMEYQMCPPHAAEQEKKENSGERKSPSDPS